MSWLVGKRIDDCYNGVVVSGNVAEGVEVDTEGFDFETTSDARLLRRLASYHRASIEAVAEHKGCLSMTCDQSKVFDKGLMNVGFALPNNVAFWSSPKVAFLPDWRCPLWPIYGHMQPRPRPNLRISLTPPMVGGDDSFGC